MGLVLWRIKFEKELPSFAEIQSQFYSQTGLQLNLKAQLSLRILKSSIGEISQLLEQDYLQVIRLEQEKQEFYQAHPNQYELMAQFRDKVKMKLDQYSYVERVCLSIEGFYEVNFHVKGNTVELESFVGQKNYGIISLVKAFIDLGGRFEREGIEKIYPDEWKKLKKWYEYKWYNKPRK